MNPSPSWVAIQERAIRLLVIAAALSGGCTLAPRERQVIFRGYDLTSYTKQGFLITPEPFSGAYESVAVLTATVIPGLSVTDDDGNRDVGVFAGRGRRVMAEQVEVDDAIHALYEKASAMGANALTNFRAESVNRVVEGIPCECIEVSGFAIRRLEGGASNPSRTGDD